MAINSLHFPVLSFEQNNPVLTGYNQSLHNQALLQDIMRQKIANQIAQSQMRVAPEMAMAALRHSLLGNTSSDISNQQKQLGLDLAIETMRRKGLIPAQQDYISNQQENNANIPSQNNYTILPMTQNETAGVMNLPMTPEQVSKLQELHAPSNKQILSQKPLNQYQQNQADAQNYRDLAQGFALTDKGGGVYTTLAQQAKEGTPAQREQQKFDIHRMADFKDDAASAEKGLSILDNFEKKLDKMSNYKFYPGLRKASSLADTDYQDLVRDSELIGNLLPHSLGIPPKGFNVKLEESLRKISGTPYGQLKQTLQHDIGNIHELFDTTIINAALAKDYRKNNGDLADYSPFAGSFENRFNSKEEYLDWLKKQPVAVKNAVHRQLSKRASNK